MTDLLLAHDFPPMGGGMARWMDAIAREYPPGELIVSTGMIDGADPSDAGMLQSVDRIDVPINQLGTVTGWRRWAKRVARLARDPAQSIRYIWCDTVRPAGYVARYNHRRYAIPYGIMLMGGDVLALERKMADSPLRRRMLRSVLRDADALVAISDWTAARTRSLLQVQRLPDAAARVGVVFPGVDPNQWRNDRAAGERFRVARNLPHCPWLITVARLVPHKGIDTAIDALALLSNECPDLKYLVIGTGPYGDEIRQQCRRLELSDRVHLLTDVDDSELVGAYSMASVYVGLSRETSTDVEGFGLSLAEASACGLPVVAASSGGTSSVVADGITGILVDAGDPGAAADAIGRLLRNPVRAVQMGCAGRGRVESVLNRQRAVASLRAIAAQATPPIHLADPRVAD